MAFDAGRGIAYCGMACVLCSYEGLEACRGCTADYNKRADDPDVRQCIADKGVAGCFACGDYPCGAENNDCFLKQCARQKGVDGCIGCPDYPCFEEWSPHQNKRNKAFIRYGREFGKQALIDRLRINHENGIVYHRPGTKPHQDSGDYDTPATELEVYRLLRYGRETPGETAAPDITVRPLSPALMADYFDFFNLRAFTDSPPWGGCYCTGFQIAKGQEKAQLWDPSQANGGGTAAFMRALHDMVVQQITSGALRGYLAYAGGLAIGWCNANDRASFPAESANGYKLYAPAAERVKVVVCFEIAPEYRGRGVATALLDRVVADARAEGYKAVEGLPKGHGQGDARDAWDYTGPVRLYEKAGFVRATRGDADIMRKTLA